jgi:DtxR family Mn-dependent transcriptional regulator
VREERVPLTDWPCDRLAVVVHVEDEPPEALAEVLRAGLRPGKVLRIVERGDTLIAFETGDGRHSLAPAVAAQVHVRRAGGGEDLAKPRVTLAELSLGEQADVVALAEDCRGLRRRRLLDLGFTPGARVEAVLASAGGTALAFRIRGTLVALRREQAEQVLIEPERVRAERRAALQR